jgi:hypothetical protein
MYAQELLTGQINRDWVKDLKLIINKINEKYSHPPYDDEELTIDDEDDEKEENSKKVFDLILVIYKFCQIYFLA